MRCFDQRLVISPKRSERSSGAKAKLLIVGCVDDAERTEVGASVLEEDLHGPEKKRQGRNDRYGKTREADLVTRTPSSFSPAMTNAPRRRDSRSRS